MSKFIGFTLLLLGASSFACAAVTVAPEIDGASALSAVVLLSGGLLVLRSRRRR